MPTGNLRVDFAGTLDEAKAFCATITGFRAVAAGPRNEHNQLVGTYRNLAQRAALYETLSAHGWDIDSTLDTPHNAKATRRNIHKEYTRDKLQQITGRYVHPATDPSVDRANLLAACATARIDPVYMVDVPELEA